MTDHDAEDGGRRSHRPSSPPGARRAYVTPFLRRLDLDDTAGKTIPLSFEQSTPTYGEQYAPS